MDNVILNDELTHWGIKGMKWGVRRYQNKDGSLTSAGQKRYDAKMSKTKAKIDKLELKRKNREEAEARDEKLKAAKAHLKDLKKGKVKSGDPAKNETDDEKKARILDKPTAKDVIENRHLFSNKEIGDLWVRLNNEKNISGLIPDEDAIQKAKRDKFFNGLENAAGNINKAAKLYNTFANIYNAFGKHEVSLPKIDLDNSKGNRETRRQEKKRLKEAQEKEEAARKKVEDERRAAKKAEKEANSKRSEDMRKYEEYRKNWQNLDGGAPKSRFSEYFKKTGEKTTITPDNNSLAIYKPPVSRSSTTDNSTNRSTVESYVTGLTTYNSKISSLSRSNVSAGRRWVADSNLLGDGVIDLYKDESGTFRMR